MFIEISLFIGLFSIAVIVAAGKIIELKTRKRKSQ
jgi:hypothetical protein